MRIIAGTAKGRRLHAPKGQSVTRPTADRVRETIFNILGQWMEGLSVLDLFAGTGALALEALSRGAKEAVLVDSDRDAVALCKANALSIGFSSLVEVQWSTVEKAMGTLGAKARTFDLVFIDPPYAARASMETLSGLAENRLLRQEARIVLEHDLRETPPVQIAGLNQYDQRSFGDTRVSLYSFG